MLTAILRSLCTGVVTIRYPEGAARVPERFRGAPLPRPGSSFDELPRASVCPSGAISGGAGERRWTLDLGRCLFCGRCADGAAGGAIELGRAVELPPPPSGAEVAERIRRVLGRSLQLRHLDAGSCNGCDWELAALLNPVYDVRRLGIDFVASPRHADGVIVTGPVTRNLEAAVRRTWEAVPEPRVVIAVGACATSGGIAGASYASAGGVAEVLPVDVFIPGCPPRPEAIIFGILLALGRVEERRRGPTPRE